MADVHDKTTRSRNMAAIKSCGTRLEKKLEYLLRQRGYSPALNVSGLPGTPDLYLPEYGVVIFVHGCFWHGHKNCKYFKLPDTRKEFWKRKIAGNILRDQKYIDELVNENLRVAVFWGCSLKYMSANTFHYILSAFDAWIHLSEDMMIEFSVS